MKIAICQTKPGKAKEIGESFAEGVVKQGHFVDFIEDKSDLYKLEQCDASFQIGEATRYEVLCFHTDPDNMPLQGYMRVAIKNKQLELNRQRFIVDCGLFKDHRYKPMEDRYFSIGLDGIKGKALFYNENSPKDRWQKRNIRIKQYRESGEHVLIIGQTHYGAGLLHVGSESDPMSNMWTNPTDYYHNLVKRVREYTDRPIIFRTHPIGDKEIRNRIRPPEGVENVTVTDALAQDIEEDLKNAWCSITRTSNGAIDSVLEGIPTITEDPVCLAHDISEHTIKNTDKPFYPNMKKRNQWLYDMSYAEWSLEEMRQGLTWKHLREHIKNASTK